VGDDDKAERRIYHFNWTGWNKESRHRTRVVLLEVQAPRKPLASRSTGAPLALCWRTGLKGEKCTARRLVVGRSCSAYFVTYLGDRVAGS
jgi:hypothetical protein